MAKSKGRRTIESVEGLPLPVVVHIRHGIAEALAESDGHAPYQTVVDDTLAPLLGVETKKESDLWKEIEDIQATIETRRLGIPRMASLADALCAEDEVAKLETKIAGYMEKIRQAHAVVDELVAKGHLKLEGKDQIAAVAEVFLHPATYAVA